MNPSLKTKYVVVLLLLFASLFSLLPTITSADQQSQLGTTTISLSGQAIPFDNGNGTGPPTSATLNLAGEVQRTGNSEFNIENLTGSLQIGSATYAVYSGQGGADQDGAIWIMANTSSNVDDHQLVLNGNIQGNALTFPAPSSRLTTQFFLALNGEITMNDEQGSNMISNVTMNPNESNASYTPLTNATPTQNSIPSITNTTLAQNSTLPQNQIGPSMNNVTTVAIQMPNNSTTLIQYSNEFISTTTNPIVTQNSTELQNPTTTSANNNVTTVAIQALNSVTTSQLTNQSISGASAPQVTVTVTQPQFNQTVTVYVTQIVADSTVTQTVTGTGSNVTITESNVTTTTVANATITVTNSTATTSSTT